MAFEFISGQNKLLAALVAGRLKDKLDPKSRQTLETVCILKDKCLIEGKGSNICGKKQIFQR